ncbi:MAG: 30S ribosomal protein S9 [Elusimicrobiota bacterium]
MAQDTGKIINTVGRRKTAVAQVKLYSGNGKVIVNNKPVNNYFSGLLRLQEIATAPFNATKSFSQYDASITVLGGGVMAQAEAIRHGVARALALVDSGFKGILKKEGYLTRDDRMVERKKAGRPKARKSFQWTKR